MSDSKTEALASYATEIDALLASAWERESAGDPVVALGHYREALAKADMLLGAERCGLVSLDTDAIMRIRIPRGLAADGIIRMKGLLGTEKTGV